MSMQQQILPSGVQAPEKISVLLVTPSTDDQAAIGTILHQNDWSISRCATVADALPEIPSKNPTVVICESELPDGTWKTILAACEAQLNAPLLLVTSRNADESLWAEVLNLGGYDVLLKPFDRGEVTRVLDMACRQRTSGQPMRHTVGSSGPGSTTLFAQFA